MIWWPLSLHFRQLLLILFLYFSWRTYYFIRYFSCRTAGWQILPFSKVAISFHATLMDASDKLGYYSVSLCSEISRSACLGYLRDFFFFFQTVCTVFALIVSSVLNSCSRKVIPRVIWQHCTIPWHLLCFWGRDIGLIEFTTVHVQFSYSKYYKQREVLSFLSLPNHTISILKPNFFREGNVFSCVCTLPSTMGLQSWPGSSGKNTL